MLKVEYSPKASEDLLNIRHYLSETWGEGTANDIMKKIISDIGRLKRYPGSGADLGRIIGVPSDYRYLFTHKNYVFYRLESDKVRIIRVLNERQDYIRILSEA